MRCPTCRADNQSGAYVCHSCLRPLPLEEGGEVPMTVPTGRAPRAGDRFVRQPTEWTTPLQVTAATYMLLSAVVSVLALALGKDEFTRAFVLSAAARGSTLSVDQLTSTAAISYNGVLVATAFVAALKTLLAVGGFLRWSSVFVVDMVVLGISALGSVGTLVLVPSFGAGAVLYGPAIANEILDLGGVCLFAWMAVAANRYGIWATRKIPVAT